MKAQLTLLAGATLLAAALLPAAARAELPAACADAPFAEHRAALSARTFTLPVTEKICYRDTAGAHIIFLTESGDGPSSEAPLSRRIEAHLFGLDASGALLAEGTVVDAIADGEAGVRFWRSVSEVRDIDGDGLAEVILAYRFLNWTYDGKQPDLDPFAGRAKLIVFHKGSKAAIRATTHDLDPGRETSASPPYFKLPVSLQAYLVKKMKRMYEDHLFGFDNSHGFRPVRGK
ncbi:MAG: M949_RS01915 family surface polysaccharide biosynthesis protein [Gammaproteobacteria bacterium]